MQGWDTSKAEAVVRGDDRCYAIAAASIIAKVQAAPTSLRGAWSFLCEGLLSKCRWLQAGYL